MYKVYIIIVNYNNYLDTIECLETLIKSTYNNFQILIVDNSVNDTSIVELSAWAKGTSFKTVQTQFNSLVEPLKTKPLSCRIFAEADFYDNAELPGEAITIIKSQNRGFAAANNIALNHVLKNGDASSLIWILNNDTVVEKYTLGKLVQAYKDNVNNKYLFASKLRYYDRPEVIQAIAGRYDKWLGKHQHIGENEVDYGQYDNYNFSKTDYPVGASIFLPKQFIVEAGLMSEDYFLYFEELDWVINGAKYGFKTILVAEALVYHKEGSSISSLKGDKKDTSLAEYYSITSRVRFIKRWYPVCLITVLPGVGWALTKRILKGKFKLATKALTAVVKILFSIKPVQLKY